MGYQGGAAGALADFVTGKAKEIHDRAMADENAQRDIEADVYRAAIKSGNLNADQQLAAIESLKKLYPHKDAKGIFDKLHEVLMHHKNVQSHVDAASAGAGEGAGAGASATPPFLSPEQARAATAATQTMQPTGASPSGQALPQPTGTAPSGTPASVPPAMRPPGSAGGGESTAAASASVSPSPSPSPVTTPPAMTPPASKPFSIGDAAAAAYPNKQKEWEKDTRAQDQVKREEEDKDAQFKADQQIKQEEASGAKVSPERKQAIIAAARGMKLATAPHWGNVAIGADDLAGQTDALGHPITAGSGKMYRSVDQDGVRQYMPYQPADSAQEKKVMSLAKDIIKDQASHGVTVSPEDAETAARSTILEQERRKTTDLPHFVMGEDEAGNQVIKGVWGRSAPAPLNLPGNMKGPEGAGAGETNKSKSAKPADDGLVPAKFRTPAPNLTTGIPTGAPGKEKSELIVKTEEEARRLGTVYEQAKSFLADPTDTNSQSLVMAYVRAQVAGAGRMTNTEIQNALKAGTWGTRLKNAWNQAVEGHLDKQFMTNMVGTIGISAKAARKMADKAKSKGGGGAGNVPPSMSGPGVSSPTSPKTAAEYLKSITDAGKQ